jgi:hypothetical protein
MKQFVVLFLILTMAAWLRINTFWLSHTHDEEVAHVALAMKLDCCGLPGYTFYGLDYESFSLDGKNSITELMPAIEGDEGGYLRALRHRGIESYYHKPLHHVPPAFPFLLMLSQKSLGGGKGYFLSSSRPPRLMANERPAQLRMAQLYAAAVPFVFSLLLVLLTFMLGKRLFGPMAGLIAAALMAISPVSIFVSQKIWAEEVSLVFILISFLFVLKGYAKRSLWPGLAAGAAAGLAFLTKQTAGIFLLSLLLFYMYDNRKQLLSSLGWGHFLLNPFMLGLAAAFILVSSWWFVLVFQTYGKLFYDPFVAFPADDVFYKLRASRPAPFILFTIGLLYLSPLFVFAAGLFRKKLLAQLNPWQQRFLPLLLFWVVVWFVLMAFVFQRMEHRHMLGAYPALAIGAGYVLAQLHAWLKSLSANWRWLGADEMLIILLLLATRWSTALVMDAVMQAQVLLLKPF